LDVQGKRLGKGAGLDAVQDAPRVQGGRPISERLNQGCFCITLDRTALGNALQREVDDPEFSSGLINTHPHLFSSSPVFLEQSEISSMLRVVQAIEAVALLPGYRDAALSWAPEIARHDFGPLGAFMGYDFHLAAEGPRLIEVNTNAGGAFLNGLLAKAQRACCAEVEQEWARQQRSGMARQIAIVDDRPREQYLYPEFLLAQRFFMKHGLEAVVADAGQLRYEGGTLLADGRPIDLVYNRLVDFAFDRPEHAALRAAYLDDAVVVTPSPRVHALFADKRNLILLSDQAALQSWGLAPDMIADLAGVPHTVLVTSQNAQQLWERRKTLFFKPAGGHGGKAVYRGDKVTKGVWADIIRGGYVAQEFAAPSERIIKLDGSLQARKVDVRLYVYDGQILLAAARLYQGQTTNFRTPGGGFAPVFVV
jgi:hypothetical protein